MFESHDFTDRHATAQCNHYLVTMDADTTILFCNNNFSTRFLQAEFSQPAISNLLSTPDFHSFKQDMTACMYSPGTCVQGTSKIKNRNDELHPIKYEMVAAVQKNDEMALYLVAHDLHEHKPFLHEAGRTHNILQSIFDSTHNVNFFISPDFKILFFNRKAYENGIKLHNKQMVVGDNILDFVKDTDNKIDHVFMEDFGKALQGENVVRETEIDYKNANSLWLRSEYTPVYDGTQLIGVSITVADITERNRYEENIRLQNEKLRKIAFIQSHQVRQPLSNILGILSFLNTNGMSADDEHLVKILKLSATQLDDVVRKVVMEAQQTELYKEFYELKANLQNL